MKRYLLTLFLTIFTAASLFAQVGGVKGKVVNRVGRTPIKDAKITLYADKEYVKYSAEDGSFLIEGIDDGMYKMTIEAAYFLDNQLNVKVEGGVKDLFSITMAPEVVSYEDLDDSAFAEFITDDESGYQDVPSILSSTQDAYDNIAGYKFSAMRFKNRGYESATSEIYMNGIKLNDAMSGYTPYSLWSGLNEATRSKENTTGIVAAEYGLGGFNGTTNIDSRPSSVRKGWRFSALTNSGQYRWRLMATYSSGKMDNGWSYAISASTRQGGNDYVKGVYYNSFSYYAGVEKNINDIHNFSLVFMGAPVERGAQNSSTQEVYDLLGDNYYNSNWGYQNGKIRNARVRNNHEPLTLFNYDFTPNDDLKISAALSYRFGRNGYSALDWYDAQDPRPDYYRNLPSYFPDDELKAAYAKEGWLSNPQIRHLNWDALYNVNYLNEEGRSKYIIEERHTDQNDINASLQASYNFNAFLRLTGGYNFRWNQTEYYKIVKDLLGGNYWLNVDQFAERDFGSGDAIQNDLIHPDRQVKEGEKYGYDYYAHYRNHRIWAKLAFNWQKFEGFVAGEGGYSTFWREGLYKKGLFPDNSYGDSKHQEFFTYSAKGGLTYKLGGKHIISGNVGYFTNAPYFQEAFVSPRTRNTVVPNLETEKIFSADLNYSIRVGNLNLRLSGFYTKINDQTDLISFYDDLNRTYTNFSMWGIDQVNYGLEFGAKIPIYQGLSFQTAASIGEYHYTSDPFVVQTVDNSEKVILDGERVYWNGFKVGSTPQTAISVGLNYRSDDYLFAGIDFNFFDRTYMDLNPLYRTDYAVIGRDTPEAIAEMRAQERFAPAFVLNANIGKSWYIFGNYNIGFSFDIKNILNRRDIKTGGYEQMRLRAVEDGNGDVIYYNRFDSKYFYMFGTNYMLNIYFRF